ncbi:hypothetical protein [Methylovorus mays]|nr:hypothetical protein [Methylovorus mays]
MMGVWQLWRRMRFHSTRVAIVLLFVACLLVEMGLLLMLVMD